MMGVPGADDIMLGYQSTSFHDALYLRELLGLRPAPEFEAWLASMDMIDARGRITAGGQKLLPARAIPGLTWPDE
jgi:ethanolamine ammonia-lyase large subunit